MDDCRENGYWRDGYWGLFWETGAPEFYLLRQGEAALAEEAADTPLTPTGGQ